MTRSHSYRYVLSYHHDESDPNHETWLIEWATEWLDCEGRQLRVSRTSHDGGTRVQISIEFTDGFDGWNDSHPPLLERLDRRVEALDLRVETPDAHTGNGR